MYVALTSTDVRPAPGPRPPAKVPRTGDDPPQGLEAALPLNDRSELPAPRPRPRARPKLPLLARFSTSAPCKGSRLRRRQDDVPAPAPPSAQLVDLVSRALGDTGRGPAIAVRAADRSLAPSSVAPTARVRREGRREERRTPPVQSRRDQSADRSRPRPLAATAAMAAARGLRRSWARRRRAPAVDVGRRTKRSDGGRAAGAGPRVGRAERRHVPVAEVYLELGRLGARGECEV